MRGENRAKRAKTNTPGLRQQVGTGRGNPSQIPRCCQASHLYVWCDENACRPELPKSPCKDVAGHEPIVQANARERCSHQLHEDAGTTTESPHIVLVQYFFAWISLALLQSLHCNIKAAKTSKKNDGEAALAKLDSQHRFWARQSQSHVEGPCCMKAWSTVSSSSSLHSNGEGPWTMISTGKRLSQHSKQATSDSANVVTASGFTPLLPLRAEDALAQRAASARHYGDEDGPSSSASRSNVPSPFPTSPSLHAAPSTPLQSSQWRGGQHHSLGASGTPGWLRHGGCATPAAPAVRRVAMRHDHFSEEIRHHLSRYMDNPRQNMRWSIIKIYIIPWFIEFHDTSLLLRNHLPRLIEFWRITIKLSSGHWAITVWDFSTPA